MLRTPRLCGEYPFTGNPEKPNKSKVSVDGPADRWKDMRMTYVENAPGPASKASERLKNFIQKQMRMSDFYQPVMIKTLLGNAGRATIRQVASALLAHDESQIEDYEHVAEQMAGKELKHHGILERQGQHFALSAEFAGLSDTERTELMALCDEAIEAYKAKSSESYDARAEGCRFCQIIAVPVGSNALAYAIRDGNPVTPLHTLIIPRRHVESFFDLRGAEQNALLALLDEMKSDIQHKDVKVEGFNVGVNDGEVAGQSVPHVHVHLIPRRRGDVENPRGGVRGVIPMKASY
jgi:diadenosine tetraphosphate (Ap4A) HIT family hydrolase